MYVFVPSDLVIYISTKMFHVLKFIYTDLSTLSHTAYVILDESEYQTFLDQGGCTTKFTHPNTGAEYSFVQDDLFPEDNQEAYDLVNDPKLHAIIKEWMGDACYTLTWTETMRYPSCTASCVTTTKDTRESKSVTLTPVQYQKFQSKGGEHFPFSLLNNHSTCSNGHSCFRMWISIDARLYSGAVECNDMRQAVLMWLRS
jgi:hypothetical protein